MGKEEKKEDNVIRLQPFWLPWGWAGPCVTTYPPLLRVGAISNLAKKKKQGGGQSGYGHRAEDTVEEEAVEVDGDSR